MRMYMGMDMRRSSVPQAPVVIRPRPPINPAAPHPSPQPWAWPAASGTMATARTCSLQPRCQAWGQLQLAICSRPGAAGILPVQARTERGPGPRRHRHHQRREGRPMQLGTSPIYSRCKEMGRAKTTQDKPAGADEPRQTRKQTEPHRSLSFSFVLIYTVWQLEGNEVIADENQHACTHAAHTCT